MRQPTVANRFALVARKLSAPTLRAQELSAPIHDMATIAAKVVRSQAPRAKFGPTLGPHRFGYHRQRPPQGRMPGLAWDNSHGIASNSNMKASKNTLENCDICQKPLSRFPTFYDAAVPPRGSWAWLCEKCFAAYGCSLGTGRGQQYDSKTCDKLAG